MSADPATSAAAVPLAVSRPSTAISSRAPSAEPAAKSHHYVQFFDTDHGLVRAVADYVAEGMERQAACILIATPAHLDGIAQALKRAGDDPTDAARHGQYVALDAESTLARFMVNGMPDRRLFRETIGPVISLAAADGRPVRAFGEMVALLWGEGNRAAAIRLEELWNELAELLPFTLLCGYPLAEFDLPEAADAFESVCGCHAAVLPTEQYSALADDEARLGEISRLQHRARLLEAEIERRKEMERALAARERELADFFDSAVEGLHKVGPDGTILWANRAELQMLGYAPEEYIGHNIQEFHADRAAIHDMLTRLLHGEPLFNHPAQLRCKDGSIREVLVSSNACIEGDEFRYTRCFTRDITAELKAARELEERVQEICALNDRLRRAVTETHHRVKNNLQIVSAMIEMQALEHKGASAVPIEQFLRLQSHIRTLAVVHDLLTASVKETEEVELVSTSDVLERLLPMLQNAAWMLTVQFEIADVRIPSKQCVSLALVINELVTNATKHGRAEARVEFSVADGIGRLEVCDDGPGFPGGFCPEEAANTGLELVQSLVRTDLSGQVTFSNGSQGGAIVRVEFPIVEEACLQA